MPCACVTTLRQASVRSISSLTRFSCSPLLLRRRRKTFELWFRETIENSDDANFSFDEVIGQERNVYRRTIVATATLALAGGQNTCVQLSYEVFSPMGSRMVEDVIARVSQEFSSKVGSFKQSSDMLY